MSNRHALMWQGSPEVPYPYTLDILTPTHIGSDEEISPIEYFIEGQDLVLCDMEALFRDPNFDADAYMKFITGSTTPYLGDFDDGIAKNHPKMRVKLDCGRLPSPYPVIKKHICTRGIPYIPGSSIKGSIRSALLYHGLTKQAESDDLKMAVEACLLKDFTTLKTLSGKLGRYTSPQNYVKKKKFKEKNYLELLTRIGLDYYLKEGVKIQKRDLDFASFLEVSDTHVEDEDLKTAVYASKVAGTRRQMPAYYEAMVPGQGLLFTVKPLGFKFNQKTLMQVINRFYRKCQINDLKWYKENGLSSAAEFLERMPRSKEDCLIRIGQGSGAFSTSLLMLARDLDIAKGYVKAWRVTGHLTEEPKTRKVLIDGRRNAIPMGWALIRPYGEKKDE